MSADRPVGVSREAERGKQQVVPVPDHVRFRNSPEPPPLDWEVALKAAADLLDDTFVTPPRSVDDPLMSDMVQELAARLCAYGEAEAAARHLPATADELPARDE